MNHKIAQILSLVVFCLFSVSTFAVIPAPSFYLNFDDSDGSPYDENDPAFANQGTVANGDGPSYISLLGDPNDPNGLVNYVNISSDAVRGTSLDLTARDWGEGTSTLVYGNLDPNGTPGVLEQAMDAAKSITITYWWKPVKSDDSSLLTNAYLLRRAGQFGLFASTGVRETVSTIYFGEKGFVAQDGETTSSIWSPWMYPEINEWIFCAITWDGTLDQSDPAVGRLKWYRGTLTEPAFQNIQVQTGSEWGDSLSTPAGAVSPLVLGNVTYSAEAMGNVSALLDEIRIYVNQTDGSAALTPEIIEEIRYHDALGHNYKPADTNQNQYVDYPDFSDIALDWLYCYAPLGCPNITDTAKVYLPYENTDGTSGQGSETNPAWQNIGTSGPEDCHYIGSTIGITWPIIGSTNPLKGDYIDISTQATADADPMQTHNYYATYGVVGNTMSEAKSVTFTFWIRDDFEVGDALPNAYIFHQFGIPTTALKYRGDQNRLQFMWNNESGWIYSDWHSVQSDNNEWIFVALVVDTDTGTIRFYTGDQVNAVSLAGEATGLTLSALPAIAGTVSGESFVMHGYNYNGDDRYAGYDMDEFRIFASSEDASGALTMEEIEEIRLFDIGN